MLPHDPTGKMGPRKPLPDQVSVAEPKEETRPHDQPYSEQKGAKPGFETGQWGDREREWAIVHVLLSSLEMIIILIIILW